MSFPFSMSKWFVILLALFWNWIAASFAISIEAYSAGVNLRKAFPSFTANLGWHQHLECQFRHQCGHGQCMQVSTVASLRHSAAVQSRIDPLFTLMSACRASSTDLARQLQNQRLPKKADNPHMEDTVICHTWIHSQDMQLRMPPAATSL